MPNWVFTTIKTDKSNEEFVKSVIEGGGICQYYMPMPEEIRNTNSPNRIISDEEHAIKEALGQTTEETTHFTKHYQTQKMVDELDAKYNASNWYDWAHLFWGTKWGDCQLSYDIDGDELYIRYQTAWSPIANDIIENFLSHLGSAEYTWEEEQGFGAQYFFEDGCLTKELEWELPDFAHQVWMDTDIPSSVNKDNFVKEMYVYLDEPYENNMGIYEPGWHSYSDWYGESSLVTDEELINKLESLKDKEQFNTNN
jgi:hypothetical protein